MWKKSEMWKEVWFREGNKKILKNMQKNYFLFERKKFIANNAIIFVIS